ncbi:hypothetical protein [Dankookia sp. P2]|uniref:hypothetical protein n=1 Tax=Dankookia sp. P2 TaxID=3423955 RepID=UPI003D66BC37
MALLAGLGPACGRSGLPSGPRRPCRPPPRLRAALARSGRHPVPRRSRCQA